MVYIISWNVAGWSSTYKYIVTHYKTLDNYLAKHKCDVLAVQEVKVSVDRAPQDLNTAREMGIES